MSSNEQTLSIIKPDAVERNLDNEIKQMFKDKGFIIVKEKKIQIEKSEAESFYKVHETKPFYNDLLRDSLRVKDLEMRRMMEKINRLKRNQWK